MDIRVHFSKGPCFHGVTVSGDIPPLIGRRSIMPLNHPMLPALEKKTVREIVHYSPPRRRDLFPPFLRSLSPSLFTANFARRPIVRKSPAEEERGERRKPLEEKMGMKGRAGGRDRMGLNSAWREGGGVDACSMQQVCMQHVRRTCTMCMCSC